MKYLKLRDFLGHGEDFHIVRKTHTTMKGLFLHHHNFNEILWIEEGQGYHLVNDQKVHVSPGSMMFIRQTDVHNLTLLKSGSALTVCGVAFFAETSNYLRARYFNESNKYFWSKERVPYHISLEDETNEWLHTKFESLTHTKRNKLVLDNFLTSLFYYLEKNDQDEEFSDFPEWLTYAIDHYKKPQHFKDGQKGFAKLADRSVGHINRTLRKHMNVTLSEIINRNRARYAARQLVLTDDPIISISYDCNFSNLSYFYKIFKHFYDTTPGDYRKLNKNIT